MTLRTTAAVLAALTIGGSTLVVAAGDTLAQDEWRHRDAVREIRDAVRDAMRDVSHDTRYVVRDVVADLVRDVMHEVHTALGWDWSDDRDYERAERRREQDERRRDEAERRRERLETRRAETARQRDARAFRTVSPSDDPCTESRDSDRGRACEVRDSRLPAPVGPLTVDASPNGGIRVEAWDQADVLVRAVVQAYGDDDAEAKALLGRIQVTAAGTRVTAEGPERSDGGSRRGGWSVSFRIWAPRQTALALNARNGGISLHGMHGESRFSTNNGGVTLDEVGGHVVGSTRNGGVNVRLGGSRWEGDGLDVETTNGGVSMAIPSGYSAELETGTVNGGFQTDLPLTVQGRLDRQVRATLGSGGPLIKVTTTNGGVRLTQR